MIGKGMNRLWSSLSGANIRKRHPEPGFSGLSNTEVFEKIYRERIWGAAERDGRILFSGGGSSRHGVVVVYFDALERFFAEFKTPPTIADLGCGDFNVGSHFVGHASSYLACDIVEEIMAENKRSFVDDRLEFRQLDLVNDTLPRCDVMIVRQVLQHLSNEDIGKFVGKVAASCSFLILTEHVPLDADYVANLDKPNGPGIRLPMKSGICLTKPPFNLQAKSARVLCEVEDSGGLIQTILYEF